jgi:hypothetical protein
MAFDEDLQVLETKIKQLKLDYEQYFLGTRPREPSQARGEVQKLFALYSQQPIQNTALRFRYNSIQARYFALRRQWDETQRKVEEGTYSRHVFKANLHDRLRTQKGGDASPKPTANATAVAPAEPDLFEAYRDACRSTGQDVSNLTREKLSTVLQKQEAALRKQYACSEVRFRVVVEDGKARLKAQPIGASKRA